MDRETWERIQTLFFEALEREDSERVAFVEAACADAPELRAELHAMLAAHADESWMRVESVPLASRAAQLRSAGVVSAAPPSSAWTATSSEDGRVGQRIGPWRLQRLLGQGGMGEVWLAERADGAYDMRAALKLVRPGWRAAQLIPRFQQERQLLARLQHPNIARLLDGGLTDAGFPYLAMEFVDGEPVTAWCGARKLEVRARLQLFRTVCEAVRFAHAHLVIHRDLKPQNILVTGDGRPILLDFGIAKLLDPDEGESAPTREEERALTPAHAAPEQLRGERVTTATDVWGLGVLLYELLSGARPFAVLGKSPLQIQQIVQQEDPPAPSAAAADRAVARTVRGDLDRIVLKALRKEPERRTRSVEELADDIDRWLAGLPVRATPDSMRYRLGKFVRRNRASLLPLAVIVALVAAFAVISARQAVRISHERDSAVAAQEDAEAAVNMLVDVFRVANPAVTPGGDTLRVGDLVTIAEQKVEAIEGHPRIESKMWGTLAEIHGWRSHPDDQRRALERAIAAAERAGLRNEILNYRHSVARLVLAMEGPQAAEPLFRESLRQHEALLGPNAADVAVAAQDLAAAVQDDDEKLRLLERSMTIRRGALAHGASSNGDSVGYASLLNAVGSFHWSRAEYAAALNDFQQAEAVLRQIQPPDHPNLVSVRSNLAVALMNNGKFEEAERSHRQLLESRRRILGDQSYAVAQSLQSLGMCLANEGRFPEAIEVLQDAHTRAVKAMGESHDETLGIASDLGISLLRAGRVQDGERMLDRLRELTVQRSGAGSIPVVNVDVSRAHQAASVGQPVSLDSLRSWLVRLRQAKPLDVEGALAVLGLAALLDTAHAHPGEAAAAYQEVLASSAQHGVTGHPFVDCARCGLELAHAEGGQKLDRRALVQALRGCERWGLAEPALLRLARAQVAAGL